MGRIESNAGLTSYLSAVSNCLTAMQNILNIASEFFGLIDISINTEKTIAISINPKSSNISLEVSRSPISITKAGEAHQYLGIFLSTKGLSGPSLKKTNSDVKFFSSMVLRKAITDKQFSYLVSAVLQFIVEYRTQFSFVSRSTCEKWDRVIRKRLKSKASLPRDFPNEAVHHPSLYNLKLFEQVQAEAKVSSVLQFVNDDLQVLGWVPRNPLRSPVKLMVNLINNFLAGVTKIFLRNEVSLVNSLPNAFRFKRGFPVLDILGQTIYLQKNFCHWKCLDPRGPVPLWFTLVLGFVKDGGLVKGASPTVESPLKLNVLDMDHFSFVHSSLKDASLPVISVYTDSSVKNFGTSDAVERAATYFSDLGLHIDVEVHGLLLSILAEMQAIALVLECILAFSDVIVLSNSQVFLDACQAESSLVAPDFYNRCWVEHCHITNLVKLKIKGHFDVLDNEHADCLANAAMSSELFLPANIKENFLLADGRVISSKAHHFIRIANDTVRRFQWEFGSGSSVMDSLQIGDINWFCTASVWHPDSHILAEYTSRITVSLCTYLMKALHRRLPVAVRKCLYNQNYPSVSCICCGEGILCEHSSLWRSLTKATLSSSVVLQSLVSSVSNSDLYTALCKGLVLDDWLTEAKTFFVDSKLVMSSLVEFIRTEMEQHGSLGVDGSLCNIVWSLPARISGGVTHLLGVNKGHMVSFGLSSSHLFFTSAAGEVMVNIVV
ncbi:hypothetical protein G9A89_000849 [Geosiphon pyriformis]|nr:hypothetical protein G9A89_000849 [Geosiphon pyriformis]